MTTHRSWLAAIAGIAAVVLYLAAGYAAFVQGDYAHGTWLLLLGLINQHTAESQGDRP